MALGGLISAANEEGLAIFDCKQALFLPVGRVKRKRKIPLRFPEGGLKSNSD